MEGREHGNGLEWAQNTREYPRAEGAWDNFIPGCGKEWVQSHSEGSFKVSERGRGNCERQLYSWMKQSRWGTTTWLSHSSNAVLLPIWSFQESGDLVPTLRKGLLLTSAFAFLNASHSVSTQPWCPGPTWVSDPGRGCPLSQVLANANGAFICKPGSEGLLQFS